MTLATLMIYAARTRPPKRLHKSKKAETAEIAEKDSACSVVT